MPKKGMYEISGFNQSGGGSTSFFAGTRKGAEAKKRELDKEHPSGNWKIGTTDLVGAYPRDDPRYNE